MPTPPHVQRPTTAAWPPYAFSAAVLRRNILIAFVVGTALSIFNQYEAFLTRQLTPRLAAKVLFNFVIPFMVSTVSAVVNRRSGKP